ncbi:MAG: ABC transporter permease [Peptostreptococcaceae bacterium]|nr:ABC transporter permease [Peptostreptococcaceae bacterium]
MDNTSLKKIGAESWQLLSKEEKEADKIVRPSMTYWEDVWRRMKNNKVAMGSLIFLTLLGLAVILIPMFYPISYSDQNLMNANLPPGEGGLFGTDKLGRDLFIRVVYGARISLTVGVAASIINFIVGVVYGGVSGYAGGRVDNIMMRIVDIIYTVPLMLIVILLMVWLGQGMKSILIAIGTTYWIGMARMVRGQIFSLKEQEYVMAAKTLGASDSRILFKHLVPNAMGPIIVTMTMSVPQAIFTEAFLSFVGLGVSAPMASWGVLCNDALETFTLYPWHLFFPAAALSLTMLAFNFLGDGLRDALDPKMRK